VVGGNPNSSTILATEKLSKRYGATLALDRLDLELREGDLFGFLGPNGSGKTTMIRLLLGLLRPTSGAARIYQCDCWRESSRIKKEIGYLPGDLRLYSNLNGRGLLKTFGLVRGQKLQRRGGELAEMFQLDLTQKVRNMSKGTRQKLGIILALAHEPRFAILDEPTVGLDPLMQDVLKTHLRDMARKGHTVFFSSHTLSDVEQLCNRVAILRRGRVLVDTTLDDLRARAHREVSLVWRDGAKTFEPHMPEGLKIKSRTHRQWLCQWDGPVESLVQWIVSPSTPPVDDLAISPPDLEALFHEYYRQ
jgi:ABC-2 type transport system ATP-binding protein